MLLAVEMTQARLESERSAGMKDAVLALWEGEKAKRTRTVKRKVLGMKCGFKRKIHSYARSQCRTTHKRQDC